MQAGRPASTKRVNTELVAFLVFIAWLFWSPPRLLIALTNLRQGRPTPATQARPEPADGLANALVWSSNVHPARALRGLLHGQPAAVYATGSEGWTAGALDHVINYDLEAWRDPHFFQPEIEQCAHRAVWEDPQRHHRLHQLYAALGAAGLQQDFLAHVRADLGYGREVFVCAGDGDSLLAALRAEPGLTAEQAAPHIWRVRSNTVR